MAKCSKCGRNIPGFSFGSPVCRWCKQHEAAQNGAISDDAVQEVMPPPWAGSRARSMLITPAIVAINAAVFLAMVLAGISIMEPTSQQLIRWGANWGPLTLGGEPWRLLSSVFLHIGIIHIALNMWCLWSLGALSESLYGRWTFAIVYLTCGLSGAVASVAWNPGRVSAGASGAIFGLAGALIASFKLGEFTVPRETVQPILRSVVTFAGYNLLFGAVSGRTDNAAHIGGLLCGLVLGALIAVVAPDKTAITRRAGVLLVVIAVVAGGGMWVQSARAYIIHAQRGNTLAEQNKDAEAIAELQKAISLRPDYAPAHAQLAHVYWKTQQWDKTETELKRYIELKPDDAFGHYELGLLYISQNRIDAADRAFTQLLALNRDNAMAHFGMGLVASGKKDYAGAAREYREVLRLDPEFAGASFNLGLALLKAGKYDEAIAALEDEKKLSGEEAETEAALSEAYAAKGMRKESAEAAQRAEELQKAGGRPNAAPAPD